MRVVIRSFFKTLRFVLGPVMLFTEWVGTPKGITRPAAQQQQIDEACQRLALYQFKTCPFCIKVRQAMRGLSLNIELRDAQHDAQHRAALLQGGGKIKAPCLSISDELGNQRWLYESDDIIRYLRERFA